MYCESSVSPQRRKPLFLLFVFFLSSFFAQSQLRQIFVDPVDDFNDVEGISLYTPSEGYIAFTKWIGYTTDSGRTYTKKFITLSNVNYNGHNVNLTLGFGISGVKAFNKDSLLVYGDYSLEPVILSSTDQGNSFKVIYYQKYTNPAAQWRKVGDMAFPQNTNIGFAVENDRVLKTVDRGKTWTVSRTQFDMRFDRLVALDDNNIYVYNSNSDNGVVLRTTNGGAAWYQLNLPMAGRVRALSFVNSSRGWLNMSDPTGHFNIYYTSNFGQNWTLKNSPGNPFAFKSMKFVNDSTGYGAEYEYITYKTTDSGRVWQPLPRDNNYAYLAFTHKTIFISGQSLLWVGGMHGFLEISTNGGGTPLPKSFFNVDTTGVMLTRQVRLLSYSKPSYQHKWYVNNQLIGTSYNISYTHNITSAVDSITLIVSDGVHSDSLKTYKYFVVPPIPIVSSFFPIAGGVGTLVTVYGSNFASTTGISFGGIPASSFTIVNGQQISAVVGNGATGPLRITNAIGTTDWPPFTFLPAPILSAPSITMISPGAAAVGAMVTLSGTNFSPTASSNVVWFGDVKASITTATTNQITCIVPVGARSSKLLLLNTESHLQANSPLPFNVLFADSSNFTPSSFKEEYVFGFTPNSSPYFNHPHTPTTGDFDGDGRADIMLAVDALWDSLLIYRNISTNNTFAFEPYKVLTALSSNGSQHMGVQDIDNDGKLDFVAATNDKTVQIIRNASTPGNISFEPRVGFPVSDGPLDIAATDFDGDGRCDIATATFNNGKLSVLRNTGSPGVLAFAPRADYTLGGNGKRLTAGDLDGDGKKDIVVLNAAGSGSNFSFFKNTSTVGNLNFAPKVDIATIGYPLSTADIHIADYDNDGRSDVIILNESYLSIFLNTTVAGNFSVAAPLNITGFGNSGSSLGNLSGRDKTDIVAGHRNMRALYFYRNLSIPGQVINDPLVNVAGQGVYNIIPLAATIGDFNGDGKPDIVASSYDEPMVVVFGNRMGIPIDRRVCIGGNITIDSDIPGTSYQWQVNIGMGFINLADNTNVTGSNTSQLKFTNTPAAWNGYLYRCLVGNLVSSVLRLKVTGPVQPQAFVNVQSSNFCKNSLVTFTASATDAGQTPAFKWQINEVDATPFFNPTTTFSTTGLNDNDRVRVIVSSTDMCSASPKDTSDAITMVQIGIAPAVSIINPGQVVCEYNTYTFTADPVNGGTAPVYQWYVGDSPVGTNSPNFTTVVGNPFWLRVKMTGNATGTCASTTPVYSSYYHPTVTPSEFAIVGISASSTAICQGTSVTFTANANQTNNIAYQWMVNNVNTGTNNKLYTTSSLSNGDKVKVAIHLTGCAQPADDTSSIITMTVNSTASPTVTISGITTVSQGQGSLLTAVVTNQGTAPVYRWEDSTSASGWLTIPGATGSTLYYYPAATGNKVRCKLTSNAPCTSSANVTSLPVAYTVSTVTAIDPVPAISAGIVYYPNPAHSGLTIDSLKISDKWQTLEIVDINGRVVSPAIDIRNKTRITVNVQLLAAGAYLAILRKKSGTAYIRFSRL